MAGGGMDLSRLAVLRGRPGGGRLGASGRWSRPCAAALAGLLLVAGLAGVLGATGPVLGHGNEAGVGAGVGASHDGFGHDGFGRGGFGPDDAVLSGTGALSDCAAPDTARAAAAPPAGGRGDPDRLLATLRHSPTGRTLLAEAARRGVRVCLDGATQLLAYYYADRRTVGVSAALPEGARLVFLAHELAHVPQHPAFSDDRRLAPRDLMLLRRLREAAAEALSTRVAWELRRAGYPAAWRAKLRSAYRDVARAFGAALEGAGPGGARGDAMAAATRAAFDQWFRAAWRLRVYDHMTLDHLAQIARDDDGLLPTGRVLTDAFLRGIGNIGGAAFLAAADSRRLTDPFYAGRLRPRDAAAMARFRQAAGAGVRIPDAGLVSGILS